ncbi:MAG TPA: ABC transporter substrate-binding protein [Galbitalea sp.]|jgi:peptide/nickel transport system substrate-binding protein
MRVRRAVAVVAVIAVASVLTACTTTTKVVEHSSATVAIAQPFSSYNAQVSSGATSVNQQLAYATNAQFEYYDRDSKLIADTSFGTVKRVTPAATSDSPLSVRYTVNRGVTWSDGVRVSRADLLLAWAANSGALNTAGFDGRSYLSPTGQYKRVFPKDVVWFDGQVSAGLQHVVKLPTTGANGRSITLSYDDYYVDWKSALEIGVPAHVVAEKAFGITSAAKADAALVDAISRDDHVALAKVAKVWNTAFAVRGGKIDTALLVSDGPYRISSVDASGSVTMKANPRYTGSHRPHIETVMARVIPTARAEVAALAAGAVDIITPQATATTSALLINLPKITISSGLDAGFEHIDLQFAGSRSGAFDSLLVRKAFLKVVPRKQIVAKVAGSVEEEATARSSFMFFPGTTDYTAAIASNGSSAYASVDVLGARALLRQAHQQHPSVCILYDPSNGTRAAEYALIRQSAALAGFRVSDCSSANWSSKLRHAGEWDAALLSWRSTNSAVAGSNARLHSGTSADNVNHYASPVTDKLLDTLAQTTSDAGQTQLLTQIDTQLFADSYGLPLFQQPSLTAFRTTVTGIRRSPFPPGVFWNIWQWRTA